MVKDAQQEAKLSLG